MRDVLDIHTHTLASGHAYNTIYEMAQSARDKGLQLLGISDHGPGMEGAACKHYFRASRCIPRELFGVKILFGIEFNIMDFDGTVDLDATFAAPLENTRAYLRAMENPRVNVIGHPDDGTYPVDFDELVRHAAEQRVLLELNEASVKPGSYRRDGRANALRILSLCEHYGAKVLVSSDAHVASDVLRHGSALALLEEVHFPEELVVNRSVEALTAALAAKA